MTLARDRADASERNGPGLEESRSANWRDKAACRHADPDLFFPIGATGPALRQINEAKRICQACPVRTTCLAWALDEAVPDGTWGGATEQERRAMRRALRRDSRTAVEATTAPAQGSQLWSRNCSQGIRRRSVRTGW